ncbi:SPW repeat protein [Thiohalomonas denitrificans]|uniref:SPW repeat protein n=1 Tax=Thiohalomonas denitrificans TaxID=415747 RepID=UPI0026ECEF78|nr:SPW repeat protein [Thiohalomonas denitrificans]
MEQKQRWQDWVSLILGIWLFLSPFFGIGIVETAAWNSWIFGAVVAVMSAWALARPQIWEEWVNLVVGIWILIAPFILAFTAENAAMWNHIIVGFIVAADAVWVMSRRPLRRQV